MEKLSIIVPVYNVEKYIEKCILSLLNQTYKNLEIILIDDGSTDKSGKICDIYSEKDERIKVIHKNNEGVGKARNTGIKSATGKYITFVDPDDWVDVEAYENIISKFNNEVEAVFYSNVEEYEPETGREVIVREPDVSGIVSGKDALTHAITKSRFGYYTSVWNKVFIRESILNINIYFENYLISEDELWLVNVLPLLKKVYLLPEPYYHWLQRTGSALNEDRTYEKWRSMLDAKIKIAETACLYNEELSLILEGRIYNDTFQAILKSYLLNNKEITKEFFYKLKKYEKSFYNSKEFSKLKKTRILILKYFILVSMPKKIVKKIGNMSRKKGSKRVWKKYIQHINKKIFQ